MGYRGARSRILWCVSGASDMLESERESSDVRRKQPAHKAPDRVEAKEPRSRKSV